MCFTLQRLAGNPSTAIPTGRSQPDLPLRIALPRTHGRYSPLRRPQAVYLESSPDSSEPAPMLTTALRGGPGWVGASGWKRGRGAGRWEPLGPLGERVTILAHGDIAMVESTPLPPISIDVSEVELLSTALPSYVATYCHWCNVCW